MRPSSLRLLGVCLFGSPRGGSPLTRSAAVGRAGGLALARRCGVHLSAADAAANPGEETPSSDARE